MKGKWSLSVKILISAIAVIIVVAEVWLRVGYQEQLKTQSYPLVYQPDDSTGYTYRPGTEARICIPSICKDFRINNQGYYGPDFSKEKSEGTFRIAIVGSSDASGLWLDTEKNFAMYLQDLFRDNGYDHVEITNFSVDGQHRGLFNSRLIHNHVSEFKPDIVLFQANIPFVHGNVRRDIYKGYVLVYSTPASKQYCIDKIDYIERHFVLKTLYDISYIARSAARYYMFRNRNPQGHNLTIYSKRRIEAPGIPFYPFSVKVTVDNLKRTQAKLREQQGELVIFTYYDKERLHETAARHGLPSISLSLPSDRSFFSEHDSHFNDKGHQEIAQRLYEKLIEERVTKGQKSSKQQE